MTNQDAAVALPMAELINQLTWNVKRGVGTFLTMEVGNPHLSVREPIAAKDGQRPAHRRLRHRRVHIVGDWHLWIQHSDWTLTTGSGSLSSDDPIDSTGDEVLKDLDGQKLISIESTSKDRWTLSFDLGGRLEIRPANYDAKELWSLHAPDGRYFVCERSSSNA